MKARIVIELEPQPNGETKFTIDAPDDPLQAIEILTIAIKQQVVKAAAARSKLLGPDGAPLPKIVV